MLMNYLGEPMSLVEATSMQICEVQATTVEEIWIPKLMISKKRQIRVLAAVCHEIYHEAGGDEEQVREYIRQLVGTKGEKWQRLAVDTFRYYEDHFKKDDLKWVGEFTGDETVCIRGRLKNV